MRQQAIIDIQLASIYPHLPTQEQLHAWASQALSMMGQSCVELTLRLVDEDEMRYLNQTFRKKSGATNVLSFPADEGDLFPFPLLGDIVICSAVVHQEALAQAKSLEAHWAHMVAHGILHLLGYDHETDDQAEEMEDHERKILALLGFEDPYE
jgi:probable rRNA maturation factor